MATDRLNRNVRADVIDSFRNITSRLPASLQVPFTSDGDGSLGAFLNGRIPDDVRAAMDTLIKWEPSLRSHIMRIHRPTLTIYADIQGQRAAFEYWQYSDVPSFDIQFKLMPEDDRYTELFEFCCEYMLICNEANGAAFYLAGLLRQCATAGQVKRIMPECVRYLPANVRHSLDNALRCSRWPKGVMLDPAKYQQALNTLAKASLVSPDNGSAINKLDVRIKDFGAEVLANWKIRKGAS